MGGVDGHYRIGGYIHQEEIRRTMPNITQRTQALKRFFGDLTTRELADFRKNDPDGYTELADLAIVQMSFGTTMSGVPIVGG